MPATEAQSGSNKTALAFLAKAEVHRALAVFTQHRGLMLQVLGEAPWTENDRAQAWKDAYEGLDGTGNACITNQGEFDKGDPEACLDAISGCLEDLKDYRETWNGFQPDEEQQADFQEAMSFLRAVEVALEQAEQLVRQCLPSDSLEAAAPEPEETEPDDMDGTDDDSGGLDGDTGDGGTDPDEDGDLVAHQVDADDSGASRES